MALMGKQKAAMLLMSLDCQESGGVYTHLRMIFLGDLLE